MGEFHIYCSVSGGHNDFATASDELEDAEPPEGVDLLDWDGPDPARAAAALKLSEEDEGAAEELVLVGSLDKHGRELLPFHPSREDFMRTDLDTIRIVYDVVPAEYPLGGYATSDGTLRFGVDGRSTHIIQLYRT